MCTVGAKKFGDFVLFKTRDPVRGKIFEDSIRDFCDEVKKKIVLNRDGMYGGINELGVALVATYVKIEDDQIPYFDDDYVRKILNAKTAEEGIEITKSFSPLVGGNIIIADKNNCFVLECGPKEVEKIEVKDRAVRTNHFLNLPYQSLRYENESFRTWTLTRFNRASELLADASNIEDIKNLLKDHENHPKLSICNHGDIPTSSAFIFDTKNIKIFYCQGNPCENEFKDITFIDVN